MGLAAAIFATLAVGALAVAVVYIVYLTVKKLKELIQKRKEKNEKQKVVFGNTAKILEENARAIIAAAPSMTMDELENICDENPYFVVNYDPKTDEIFDYQTIKTDGTDRKVSEVIREKGIVVFD